MLSLLLALLVTPVTYSLFDSLAESLPPQEAGPARRPVNWQRPTPRSRCSPWSTAGSWRATARSESSTVAVVARPRTCHCLAGSCDHDSTSQLLPIVWDVSLRRAFVCVSCVEHIVAFAQRAHAAEQHWLYVAVPGVRDYLEYGGHGVLVFDIDDGHKFVQADSHRRRRREGQAAQRQGHLRQRRHRAAVRQHDQAVDVPGPGQREGPVGADVRRWLRSDVDHARRQDDLSAVAGRSALVCRRRRQTAKCCDKIVTNSGAHNTICGPRGKWAYLAGLKSPLLRVVDTARRQRQGRSARSAPAIRPFTIDGRETRCYVNVNDLLGFEIGDLQTGAEAGPRRSARVSRRARPSGTAAPATASASRPTSGSCGCRRRQPPLAHVRRARHAAAAAGEHRAARRAGLDHLQHRRPATPIRRPAT